MRLGHRARDDDVRQFAGERDAIGIGKRSVSFIDDEHTREGLGNGADDVWRESHAERGVRIRQEEDGGTALRNGIDVDAKTAPATVTLPSKDEIPDL